MGVLRTLVLLSLVLTLGWSVPGQGAEPAADDEFWGIKLLGMPLPAESGGIILLEPAVAVGKMKDALKRLRDASAFSANHLSTLKKNGQVVIVYDAKFRAKQRGANTIAAFFPDFFKKTKGGPKHFIVVIGRFGVKWPRDKLAALIAHELVGHGLQHFRGHGEKDRKIDLECEALIYEMRSHQDLGLKRDSKDMIEFRKSVRSKWCADFGRYMTGQGINADQAWGFGNPDIPVLLKHFTAYRAHLRKTGVAGKAIAAVKAKRAEDFERMLSDADKTRVPQKMLVVGRRYLKGIGVPQDRKQGALWIGRAAEKNHPQAQLLYGALLSAGRGVPKDRIEAYKYYLLAKRNGERKADKYLQKLAKRLFPKQIKEAEKRAAAVR